MAIHDTTENRRRAEHPVELTATEARQGSRGRPVLVVLVAGLLLAMVAWAAAEFFGMAIAPANDTGGGDTISAPASTSTNDGGATTRATEDTTATSNQNQTAPAVIDQQPTSNQ